jgi:hypothetical protein
MMAENSFHHFSRLSFCDVSETLIWYWPFCFIYFLITEKLKLNFELMINKPKTLAI